jgi:uncharacterized protein (TIGR02646 family)
MHQAHRDLQTDLASLPVTQHSTHARACFDALDKATLRASLYGEQHHLCVYCEGRVKEANTPSVEHWEPVNHAPRNALNWDNLYLSCSTDATCDHSKAGQSLGLPRPTQKPYERVVGFTSGGEIYVRADAPLTQAERQALELAIRHIVNLNHRDLIAARKMAIDVEKRRLKHAYPGRHLTDAERATEAQRLLAAPKREAFASIRVAYLERTLGDRRP